MEARGRFPVRIELQLEVPSRLEMLDKAGALVGQVADVAGFDGDSRLDIQLAAHEALLNAIVHGHRSDETRRVTLEAGLDRGGFELRVRDEGPGFDPARVPDPLALENLCRSSGRGLLMMKALMDVVEFRRPPAGGMEVIMRKRVTLPGLAARMRQRSAEAEEAAARVGEGPRHPHAQPAQGDEMSTPRPSTNLASAQSRGPA